MRRTLRLFVFMLLAMGVKAVAQPLTGSITVPSGAYLDLKSVIDALNTNGVGAGGVIINITAGTPDQVPSSTVGFQLGSATLNASVGAANPIVINGNGTSITAFSPGSGTTKGIFTILGTDYVTIDNLNLKENALNLSSAQQMTWGYALLKLNNNDGCQHVTIKNCTITMGNVNTTANSGAIYAGNHTAAVPATQLTPTNISGTNSYNTFTNNKLQGYRFNGIYLSGFTDNTATHPYYDQGNTVGGTTVALGNAFQDFGIPTSNSSQVAGLRLKNQNDITVQNNTFKNVIPSGTIANNAPLAGVYFESTKDVNFTCNDNTFELTQSNTTSATYGIYALVSGKGRVVYSKNKFQNFSFPSGNSGECTMIANIGINKNISIVSNEIRNHTGLPKSGTFTAINIGGSYSAGIADSNNVVIKDNIMDNVERVYGPTGSLAVNFITGFSYQLSSALPGSIVVTGNKVSNVVVSEGNFNGIYVSPYVLDEGCAHNITVADNSITKIKSYANGTFSGINLGRAGNSNLVYNNTIGEVSMTTGQYPTVDCITFGRNKETYSSDWGTILPQPTEASYTRCYNNKIYNLDFNGFPPTNNLYACRVIYVIGGTSYVYNNFISDIRHPKQITVVAIPDTPTVHRFVPAGEGLFYAKTFIEHNTIQLGNGSIPSGITVTGILFNRANDTLHIANNIINLNMPGNATNSVACLRGRFSPGANVVPRPVFLAANNIYYTPAGINNYIYVEEDTIAKLKNGYAIGGATADAARNITNDPGFNTGCSLYKGFMGSSDVASFYENNLVAGTQIGTLVPAGSSYAKASAKVIPYITTDFSGAARGSNPDRGALQFTGTAPVGGQPPAINVAAVPATTYCLTAGPVTATITGVTGVNTTAGTAPRLYYKKATESNVFGNYPAENVSSFNGWKYVEATGTAPNFSFTMDYSKLTSAVVVGDSISYFVIAQDNSSTPVLAVNTAGFSAGCMTSVNLTPAMGNTTNSPVSKGFRVLALPASLNVATDRNEYCTNGNVRIWITNKPAYAALLQWQENRGSGNVWYDLPGNNGDTLKIPGVTVSNNYRIVIKCGTNDVLASNSLNINIATAPAITTASGSRCGPGSVTLRSSGSGNTFGWYESLTGGKRLQVSDTFITPVIAATKDYYVTSISRLTMFERLATPTASAAGALYKNGSYGLTFDVFKPFILDSVSLRPETVPAGSLDVLLVDGNGDTVQRKNILGGNMVANASNRVHLGFDITPGNNYKLILTNVTGTLPAKFSQSYPDRGFPFVVRDLLSVTNSARLTGGTDHNFSGGVWYYFMDWVISTNCESPVRTIAKAVINTPPAVTVTATPKVICDQGSSVLSASSANTGYTYTWKPMNVTGNTTTVSPLQTTEYYLEAIDQTIGTYAGCTFVDTITVTVSPVVPAFFNVGPVTTFCKGDSVMLSAANTGTAYQWQRDGNDISGATDATHYAKDLGNYRLTLTAGACSDTSGEVPVTVHPLPTPVISVNGQLLTVSGGSYTSYQWYRDGQKITGATKDTITITGNGSYFVEVVDANGCKATAYPSLGVTSVNSGVLAIKIYPNPASNFVRVDAAIPVDIAICTIDGKEVKKQQNAGLIDISDMPAGIYMIRAMNKEGQPVGVVKLIKYKN